MAYSEVMFFNLFLNYAGHMQNQHVKR